MTIELNRRTVIAGVAATSLFGRARAARSAMRPGYASDADLLERAYTALHPGLLRYASAAEMTARFGRLHRDLSEAGSLREAYLALAAMTAAVRCGHSYPNFFNQSAAIRTALFEGRDRLPFHLRWLGERMIVTRDLSPAAPLAPGSEILSIEGRPARDILRALLPLVRADGHNDGKRRALLEVNGREPFETFDIYLPMALPDLVARGTVRVIAADPKGKVVAPYRTADRCRAARPRAVCRRAVERRPLWTLEHRPKGVAVLSMPTWSVYNGGWNWTAWLNSALDDVVSHQSRALIVDLRGNEGGLDCGDPILARVIGRDLAVAPDAQRVRYRTLPPDLAPHVDTWDDSFRNWGAAATGPRADGFYDLVRGDAQRSTVRPGPRRFAGRLIVLIDAANSSATFEFARLVRANGLGTLVGETTGGNQRGINGGAFLFLRLPTTGIEVDIPLIGTFPSTPQPDGGISPDIAVPQTQADIANGFDPGLSRAIALSRGVGVGS